MSFADKIFIDMCRDIIENGCSTGKGRRFVRLGRWNPGLHSEKIRCGEQV